MGNAFEAAAYAQISSASISFVSSLTMATAIVRSDGGLTSPFRRLIFGLSVTDVLQSFGLIVGPFAIPASDISPFGVGNQGTCSAQGFVLELACHALPIYTCGLSYYYYCKLKYDMSDETFSRRIEWKTHGASWLAGLSVSITALATKTLNTNGYTGSFCSCGTFPADCRQHPDLYDAGECRGAKTVLTFDYIFLAILVLCQICIIRNVSFMLWHIIKRDRTFGGANTPPLPTKKNARNSSSSPPDKTSLRADDTESGISLENDQELPVESAKNFRKTIRRTMMVQSCLYVAAFFVTYSLFWIYLAMFMLGLDPPSSMLIASSITCPLGGLFNILVFTRPSVWILRRRHSYSWLKAFVLVIKAGGEVPHEFRDDEPKNKVPSSSQSLETPAMILSAGLVGEVESEVSVSAPGNRRFYKFDVF